jgi:TolA-binding protein
MSIFIILLIIFFIALMSITVVSVRIEAMTDCESCNTQSSNDNIKVSNADNCKNSQCITHLQDQIDTINTSISDINGNITTLQSQLQQIAEAQANTASDITNGNKPLDIDASSM